MLQLTRDENKAGVPIDFQQLQDKILKSDEKKKDVYKKIERVYTMSERATGVTMATDRNLA